MRDRLPCNSGAYTNLAVSKQEHGTTPTPPSAHVLSLSAHALKSEPMSTYPLMSDINRCQFFERGPEARARCGRLLEAQQEAEREAAAKVARLAERPTSGALYSPEDGRSACNAVGRGPSRFCDVYENANLVHIRSRSQRSPSLKYYLS